MRVRAAEVITWWGSLVGVWLLTLNSFSALELVVAGLCAVPCSIVLPFARDSVGGRWRPSPEFFWWLLLVPQAVVADTAVLGGSLSRRARGSVAQVPVGDGDSPTRQAVATLAVSSCPGTVVLDFQRTPRALVVHRLGSRTSALERAVRG